MPAPVATARGTPTGIMLREGFHVKITLAGNTTISFWERVVQPFGFDGGPPIPQTTQFNVAIETKWPQTIYDTSSVNVTDVAYDPGVISQIVSRINVNDQITVTFADGSTVAFWGYLRSFTPNPMQKGQQPTASLVIEPTHLDNAYAEQVPVLTSVVGT